MDDDQDIGFQDPDEDDMPSEMKDHMLAAFAHHAGMGPHPGQYKGPTKRKGADPDEPTETELDSGRQKEANASKMRAAQTGGGDPSLGPSAMDQAQVKQRGAIQKQADTQTAQQAAQAQAQAPPVNAPAAPTGPQGTTTTFPAQKGAVGGPGNAQQPSQTPPPPAPGPGGPPPDEGEEEAQ